MSKVTGSAILVVLALAAGHVLAAEQCSSPEDETCLIQTHQEIKKPTKKSSPEAADSGADLDAQGHKHSVLHHRAQVKAGKEPKVKKWYHHLQGAWGFESEYGGLSSKGSSKVELFKPEYPAHPMWKPEWHRMLEGNSLLAGFMLWAAGVLCCAGGIGGGGIYVTVLMVFGALSVHDAIPLSKVVVFAASTPSLILNLMKTIKTERADGGPDSGPKSLIDWNVCRIVVPWALIGTLCGVFLNTVIPPVVIVATLCVILICITIMTANTGWRQHCEEKAAEELEMSSTASGGTGEEPPEGGGQSGGSTPAPNTPKSPKSKNAEKEHLVHDDANIIENIEIAIAVSMLAVIISCGTIHFHAERCAGDSSAGQDFCTHPIAVFFTAGQMSNMKDAGYLANLGNYMMLVAIFYCTCIGIKTSHSLIERGQVYGSIHRFESYSENDSPAQKVILAGIVLMSLITGCLAGLVGIGGGLIFSPVFIQMLMDPHIAVATSATCVIFTSSSTTFQYLFADRIIVSLIFSFCIPHLFAAYTGTKIVHHIQDHYGAKKSWITWIVALGVGISCLLAISKLFDEEQQGGE